MKTTRTISIDMTRIKDGVKENDLITGACSIHGDFNCTAEYAWQTGGCPSCNSDELEEEDEDSSYKNLTDEDRVTVDRLIEKYRGRVIYTNRTNDLCHRKSTVRTIAKAAGLRSPFIYGEDYCTFVNGHVIDPHGDNGREEIAGLFSFLKWIAEEERLDDER